jgi:glycosyltransferase involved in cell wall biosynthesis
MEPRKNLSRLLEAFDDAGNWSLESDLVLVTDPASGHAPALRTQLATMACADRVRILYNVPGPELAGLYSAARTFAFPSLSEGFGFPPLEAMLCRTPVLASDLGSLPEVLDDAALYVDAYDTRSIRDGLLALDRDERLRERLIGRGTQVAERYSWRTAAHQTAGIYRRVAGVALAMTT